MSLRARKPTRPVVAQWRTPIWQRLFFTAAGIGMAGAAFWLFKDEPSSLLWLIALLLGCSFVTYALRPKLTLHEDAIHIRGFALSRVIPIEEISAMDGGYGGLDIWWGDEQMSEVTAIGEQANVSGMPGSDGRRHSIKSLVLATRDAYLTQHGLTALPDPRKENERLRREFQERGWADYPKQRERRAYRIVE